MKLLYNGRIYNKTRFYEAVVIDGEIIKQLGNNKELKDKYKYDEKIDLKDNLVLPGFNDAHMHVISYAKNKRRLDIRVVKTKDELIKLGKNYLQTNGKTLVLNGYNEENYLDREFLNRDDLDEISTKHPIICYRVCGHKAIVNSKAIEVLDLKGRVVEGGVIDLELGILYENALMIAETLENDLSVEDLKEIILKTVKDANSLGITSISSNDVHLDYQLGERIIVAYDELIEEGRLNARINEQIAFLDLVDLDNFYKSPLTNNYFRFGPLKIFSDGSLGAKTAALKKPYLNDKTKGILTISYEKLRSMILHANNRGIQVAIHAIGDAAINLCLDAFNDIDKNIELRNTIIHVQITDYETLKRFHDLKVNAIVQPIFISEDMETLKERISPELASTSYAFNTLSKLTNVAFSSDTPYGSFSVLEAIYVACTRKSLTKNEKMNEAEAVSVKEAIAAYTELGSYLSFEERVKGKIEEGYLADFTVLDRDIFNVNIEEIIDTGVLMTIVGGRIVYDKRA